MRIKDSIVAKARAFLEVVSAEVGKRFGENSSVQQAIWWSKADPEDIKLVVLTPRISSTLQSGGHDRQVFNWFRANMLYQSKLMHDGFPEQSDLQDAITATGFPATLIHYNFLLPLVQEWCKLPTPFDLTQQTTQDLLEEFAKAVIDQTSATRYRDVILGLDLDGTPVELEAGISIRPIQE